MVLNRHIHHLDGLRGVAALWVAFYHSWAGGHLDHLAATIPGFLRIAVFEQGFLGVPVFFVLSGFVIPYSAARQADATFGPVRFMRRRWRRLSPPYYAALVLTVVVGVAEGQVRDQFYDVPSTTEFLAHVLYLQDLTDQPRIGLLFWTLAFEMQFYIMFAVMKWLAGRSAWPYASDALLALALAVAALWPLGITDLGSGRGVFIVNWYLFLIGQAVFMATQRPAWRYPTAIYIAMLAVSSGFRASSWVGAGAATAVLVVILVSTRPSPPQQLLSTSAAKFIGLVSYSLYLVHNAVAGPAYFVLDKIVDPGTTTEVLGLAVVTAAQLAVAWIWYRIFEQWSIAWSRQLRVDQLQMSAGTTVSG